MVDIKTYESLGEDLQTSFVCKRMEAIHESQDGHPDTPHRHNFYTIIFAVDVKGLHHIDFHAYTFQSPCVFFVSPGQVHQVIPEQPPKGFAFLFTQDFLIKNDVRPSFISDLNLFRNYGESPPLVLDERQSIRLKEVSEYLAEEYKRTDGPNIEKLGALLKWFLIECAESCDLPMSKEMHSQGSDSLLRRFRDLVETHYKKAHKVGFYADHLHITAGHLNKSIKALTGNSAKEFIQKRITTEAKRLSMFTDMASKEIAYDLGFDDPAHFSVFFKNCTGESLSVFRKGKS